MPGTAKLDHIGLSVENLETQMQWYTQALNMRATDIFSVDHLQIRGAFLVNDAGTVIELLERSGSRPGLQAADPAQALLTRGYGHICLRVRDVDTLHAQLLAAGARERMAPQPSPEAGVRMSFVADPEGNLIELLDREGPVRA